MIRFAFVFVALLLVSPAQAQLRGHGGPVRALAISPDGTTAISGSFDTSAIRWSLTRNAGGTGAALPRKRGERGGARARRTDRHRRRGWPRRGLAAGLAMPAQVLEGHTAPVVGLAVSPDGKLVASASWDRTIRLWPLGGGAPRVLEGHQQNVNGVAFTPDGQSLVSAGYDLTLRIWPLAGGPETTVTLPTPLNSVAVARDGEIVAGGADGRVLPVAQTARLRGELDSGQLPIISVAVSPDGALSRQPASAARSRSSTGGRGRCRARWSAPDCRCGPRRSCRTAARWSPAAPTA